MTTTLPDVDRLLAEMEWLDRLARSLVRGRDAADDIVQETLVRALAAPWASLRDLRGWLAMVAHRVARRRWRTDAREARRRAAWSPPEGEPDVTAAMARAEAQERVLAALRRLPEPYRVVLLLRFESGHSYSAIAVALAVPIETVRTRIKRGLHQLRDDLDARAGGRAAWALPLLGPGLRSGALAVTVAAASCAGLLLAFAAWSSGDLVQDADGAEVFANVGEHGNGAAPTTDSGRGVAMDEEVFADRSLVAPPAPYSAAPVAEERVRGRVLSAATGFGVAGAEVRIIERFVRIEGPSGTTTTPSPSFTDAEGWFDVRLLSKSSTGGAPQCLVTAVGFTSCCVMLEASQDLGSIVLREAQPSTVQVVDGHGQPVVGAEVLAWWSRAGLAPQWSEELGVTDPAGRWSGVILDAPQQDCGVVVVVDDIAEGAPLRRGGVTKIVMPELAYLVVDVVDDQGLPVPEAMVFMEPTFLVGIDREPRICSGNLWHRLRRSARADDNGRARLPACAATDVVVTAMAHGHRGDCRRERLTSGAPVLRVVLPRPEWGTVRGRVVDARTHQSIVAARVGSTTTDAGGEFEIVDLSLRSGRVQFRVEATGYVPITWSEPVGGRIDPILVSIALEPIAADPSAGRAK
jgi:RNA polymerase sigma-70 factor (ECF subfamily)